MSHPFGDLLGQFLHRRHGLSQFKLADGINQPPSVISEMCKGKRLSGSHARTRVVDIIQWLLQHKALRSPAEANELLNAAGLSPLNQQNEIEAGLLVRFSQFVESEPHPLETISRAGSVLNDSAGTRRHNLPEQFTRFFGRSEQINDLAQLIKTHRMVTLTGAGGVGKTRLALEVAAQVLDTFKDGAWFIDLGVLSDPLLVPQRLLEVLQAPEQPAQPPMVSLTNFLGTKNLLLVLDNCEHLIDGVAQLSDRILRSSPLVSLLATSREAVHIPAEFPWQVPSLTRPLMHFDTQAANTYPTGLDRRWPTISTGSGPLEQFEAVRLFVDRVQNLEPSFRLQDDNAWAVAHICSRLDGIPLALEMAAAWISALTIEEIATRLSGAIDSRFHMLTSSSRTISHRQQTLRATMEWSFGLLSPAEQNFFYDCQYLWGAGQPTRLNIYVQIAVQGRYLDRMSYRSWLG